MGGSTIQAGGISRVRVVLLGGVIAVLVGIVGVALQRETLATGSVARGAGRGALVHCELFLRPTGCDRPLVGTAEPAALTAEEEVYAESLWTVHSATKVWAIDLDFAASFTRPRRRTPANCGRRCRRFPPSLLRLNREARAIAVPSAMRAVHEKYLGAIQLYENAAAEMLEAARDGDDRRLLVAQGMSQHAAEEMLRVGDVLWPGEYKPN